MIRYSADFDDCYFNVYDNFTGSWMHFEFEWFEDAEEVAYHLNAIISIQILSRICP